MEHIFDRIDKKLRDYSIENKKAPKYLILGLNSLAYLRDELDLPVDDSLPYYKGFKIVVDESEDMMDASTVDFV
jgi:hypothetical protein